MALTAVQQVLWGTEPTDAALQIAQKGFPAGAVVQCKLCGHEAEATTAQIAEFLSAWPRHCGYRMEIDAIQ